MAAVQETNVLLQLLLKKLQKLEEVNKMSNNEIQSSTNTEKDVTQKIEVTTAESSSLPNIDLPDDVLYILLSYFEPKELLTLRLTCRAWNNVVSQMSGKCFKLKIKTIDDAKEINNSTSDFVNNITNFQLSVKQFDSGHTLVYKSMFENSKPLKTLAICNSHPEVISLVLTSFTTYLQQVENLTLASTVSPASIEKVNFSEFKSIKNLTIVATGEASEYGLENFVIKFLQGKHHLESFVVKRHLCIGELKVNIITNLVKSECLQTLDLWTTHFELRPDHMLAIVKGGLKNMKCFKARMYIEKEPQIFYRFLHKFVDSLEKLSLRTYQSIPMDSWPFLKKLRSLTIEYVNYIDFPGLSFCGHLPALKKLKLRGLLTCAKTNIIHENLELLEVLSNSCNVVGVMLKGIFPNLRTVVIPRQLHADIPTDFLKAKGIAIRYK